MSIPLWNFVLNAEHRKFLHSTSFVATYCQPTWALSVENATVLGRTKLTILATVDVRPTSLAMQFTAVSVHLSLYARELVALVHLQQTERSTIDDCSVWKMTITPPDRRPTNHMLNLL